MQSLMNRIPVPVIMAGVLATVAASIVLAVHFENQAWLILCFASVLLLG